MEKDGFVRGINQSTRSSSDVNPLSYIPLNPQFGPDMPPYKNKTTTQASETSYFVVVVVVFFFAMFSKVYDFSVDLFFSEE